ncbi:MAG: hypothetical protein ACK51C_11370, partial [Brevundimonas sp.]|uniref:hypothetical protein n=1 Tax=Brevundimonas sp. TaxID=1871086 RepID=UPI00391F7505
MAREVEQQQGVFRVNLQSTLQDGDCLSRGPIANKLQAVIAPEAFGLGRAGRQGCQDGPAPIIKGLPLGAGGKRKRFGVEVDRITIGLGPFIEPLSRLPHEVG